MLAFQLMVRRMMRLAAAAAAGLLAAALLLAAGMARAAPQAAELTVGEDCATIQACIDQASPGDSVVIPANTYTESLTLNKPVSLTGALSSTTVIRAVEGQRVLTVTGALISHTRIASLTLAGGQRLEDGACPEGCGGGLWVTGGAHVLLAEIIITGNSAAGMGGGIYLADGGLELVSGLVVSNSALAGAGAALEGAQPVFTQTGGSLERNMADAVFGTGGGLWVGGGAAVLNGGQIVSNSAAGGGGVNVAALDARLSLAGVAIGHNTAAFGAGVLAGPGAVAMSGGRVFSNSASQQGGGLFVNAGIFPASAFTLTGGVIEHNLAVDGGGAFLGNAGVLLAGGQIISNSASQDGGGVYAAANSADLAGTRIAGNMAGVSGGGVFVARPDEWGLHAFTQTAGVIEHNSAHLGAGLMVFTGVARLAGGQISDNTTFALGPVHGLGAGAAVYSGALWLDGGLVVSNSAGLGSGGGVALLTSAAAYTQTSGILAHNNAAYGGGLYVPVGQAHISGGQIVSNTAYVGAALYQGSGAAGVSVTAACIVGNEILAVFNDGGPQVAATGNWWGAPDGPGGVGPGHGDSVSADVDYAGFLTDAPPGCPTNPPPPPSGLSAENSSPTPLGQTTHFSASLSSGVGVTYTWDFGDGSLGSGLNASHVYAVVGEHTAVVTASNTGGQITATTPVTITNLAPWADAGPDQSVAAGASVQLDGSASSDPDAHLPLTYGWAQAGGPVVALSSEMISQPVFSAPGASAVLTFSLTVTDAAGLASAPDTVTISVADGPPVGLSAANSSPTPLGQTTHFSASLSSGVGVTYTWDFRDGQMAGGLNASHVYAAVGQYTAVVTASNTGGQITATTLVTITNLGPAGLSAANSSPTPLGQTTHFSASLSSGVGVTYTWDFGDGQTAGGLNASHVYAAVGQYTAVVTASNTGGVVSAETTVVVLRALYLPLAANGPPMPIARQRQHHLGRMP